MALTLPLDGEVFGVIVDTVGCSMLPLVLLTVGRGAGLILMRLVAIAALVPAPSLGHLVESGRDGKLSE